MIKILLVSEIEDESLKIILKKIIDLIQKENINIES